MTQSLCRFTKFTALWTQCPWLWQDVEVPKSEFLGAVSNAHSPEYERAAQSIELLDAGQIEEAMSLYGVTFADDLHHLLGGQRITPPACRVCPNKAWTDLLVETLRQSVPWRLPVVAADEAERLTRRAKQKKGRRKRPPNLKLVIFPGQHHQSRARLMLTCDIDGHNPRFDFEVTASNARLHDTAWKLPIGVDFLRYDLDFANRQCLLT